MTRLAAGFAATDRMSPFLERYGPWGIVAGASAGLGAAFARSLARRGIHVIVVARRGDVLRELTEELERTHGIETHAVTLDLAATDARERLAEVMEAREVGIAVHNAAFAPVGAFVEQPLERLLRVVDVNVRAPLMLANLCAPPMIRRERGGLVLMSSLAGEQGTPRISTYAASKAFNSVLAEGLWHELRASGVDVVASCAGAIRTPGYADSNDDEVPGMLDADVVADATLDALGRGPRVVPGLTNLLAYGAMRLLPRRLAVAIMANVARDFS